MKPRPRILMYMQFYYSGNLHRGIAQYAMEAGWSLDTSMYRSGLVPNRKWDGVIGSFAERDAFYSSFVQPNHIPAVSLTSTDVVPCVLPDNLAIGKLGAEHLIGLGYKNFAFYFWQSKLHEKLRAKAFKDNLKNGIHRFYKINDTLGPRVRRQSVLARLSGLRRRLQRLPKPIAIMAPMDDLASEIVDLCTDIGLKIPEDVGVLGVNNDKLICDFAPVPISSVDDDEFKIGYEGAALLDRIMKGEAPPLQPLLVQPKRVEIRKSTDLIAITTVPDRQVVVAVRYITQHFGSTINTSNVARAAGVSTQSLQGRFVRHMGCTIHDYIFNKRIEHAKLLLQNPDNKVASVGEASGFGTRERFSRAFKEVVGMNPRTYCETQQANNLVPPGEAESSKAET